MAAVKTTLSPRELCYLADFVVAFYDVVRLVHTIEDLTQVDRTVSPHASVLDLSAVERAPLATPSGTPKGGPIRRLHQVKSMGSASPISRLTTRQRHQDAEAVAAAVEEGGDEDFLEMDEDDWFRGDESSTSRFVCIVSAMWLRCGC